MRCQVKGFQCWAPQRCVALRKVTQIRYPLVPDNMATGSDAIPVEMKKAVQAAVREAVAEEMKAQRSKGKGRTCGSGEKTEYDNTRWQGPDSRDPRASPDQWPCFGRHAYQNGANRYGKWSECVACGHRASYMPAKSAPGEYTRTNLPQNVTEALERLRTTIKDAGAVEAKDVKNMIDVVAKEKRLIYGRPKSKAGTPQPEAGAKGPDRVKPKEKEPDKEKTKERKKAVEISENSDEDFETVEPPWEAEHDTPKRRT